MSRHSSHTVRARTYTLDGDLTELDEVSVTLNLDESQSPYGTATVTCPVFQDSAKMDGCDPLVNRGLRIVIEMSESVGDPVVIEEVTADHGGDVSTLTAAYGPGITPAKLTAQYFRAWNDGDVRAGGTVRANLIVTARDVSHRDGRMTFEGATDEAMTQTYKLLSKTAETSGSTSLRATVNYALAKVGAALLPGSDATITEASATVWEPGTSAWDYMQNVAESLGMVVRCDERRRWTLTERDTTRSETVSLTQHVEAMERIELAAELTADAVIVCYDWTDPLTGTRYTRYETATMMGDPIIVVRIDRSVPYPGPGAATYWLKRLHARGRVLELGQVADYTMRPGMGFSATMPYAPARVGWLESVTWTLPEAESSVTTRGAAVAVANAIDLWPDGLMIDSLAGTIDSLVTGG